MRLLFDRQVMVDDELITPDEVDVLDEKHRQDIVKIALETGRNLNAELLPNHEERYTAREEKVVHVQRILEACVAAGSIKIPIQQSHGGGGPPQTSIQVVGCTGPAWDLVRFWIVHIDPGINQVEGLRQ